MARRELLQFASAVHSRICRGTPNRESKDAPGFADKVDKHIQSFQPYLQRTGRSYMCVLYIVLLLSRRCRCALNARFKLSNLMFACRSYS